jgi:hypothetical protein
MYGHRIEIGEQLTDEDKESILKMAKDTVTFHYGIV